MARSRTRVAIVGAGPAGAFAAAGLRRVRGDVDIDLFERQGFDGAVLVVSFNPSSIAASKLVAPDVPTGFLTTDLVQPREALAYAASAGHDMVLPGTRASIPAGPSFVDEVHAAGLRLGTWTVDDPGTVRMLLDRGFDAVASNDPRMALAVLADHVGS